MAASGRKLNWVVVGIGDISTRRVIPAIESEPRSVLHGVVSRDPEKGRRYSEHVWNELRGALDDPAVDAVYLATPVFLHGPQTVAALQAGKHVLCEKPMAMNYAEARGMLRAAQETGRTLGVAYYRRLYPKVLRARELMAQGVIGRPVWAEATAHDWFEAVNGHRAWLLDPRMAGGGPLYDTASHRIDTLNFFFGAPARVSGHLSRVVHEWEVEDAATILIDYESGVRAMVDARRHSRVVRDEFRIVGVDGEMSLTPLNGPELTYPGAAENLPAHANLHYPCVENFVAAVLDGAHLWASGESSIWTDWVTEQARESAAPRRAASY